MADDPSLAPVPPPGAASPPRPPSSSAIPMHRIVGDVLRCPHAMSPECNSCHGFMTEPALLPCNHWHCLPCARRADKCGAAGCGAAVVVEKIVTDGSHVETMTQLVIGNTKVKCEHAELGCCFELPLGDMNSPAHLDTCPGTSVECEKCGERVSRRRDLEAHMATECAEGTRRCGACEEAVRRREWSGHLQTEKHQSAVLALAMHNQQQAAERLAAVEAQLAATSAAGAATSQATTELSRKLEARVADCKTLREENDKVKADLAATSQTTAELSRKLEAREADCKTLREENDKLKADLAATSAYLQRLDPVASASAATLRNLTSPAAAKARFTEIAAMPGALPDDVLIELVTTAEAHGTDMDVLTVALTTIASVGTQNAQNAAKLATKRVWAVVMAPFRLFADPTGAVPTPVADCIFAAVTVLLKSSRSFLSSVGHEANKPLYECLAYGGYSCRTTAALELWETTAGIDNATCAALAATSQYGNAFKYTMHYTVSDRAKLLTTLRAVHAHSMLHRYNQFIVPYLLNVANRYKDNADVLDVLFRVCTDAVKAGHTNDVAEKMMPLVPRLFTNADFAGPIDAAVGMLAAIAASGSATACKDLFTYCKTTLMPLLLQPPDTVRGSTFVSICEVVASLGDADQTFVKTTLADPMFISTYAQRVWDRTRADNLRGDVVQGPLSLLAYTLTPQDDESADTKAVAEDVRAKLRTGEAVRHIISVMPSPGATHKVALRMLQALASDDDGAKEVETALELLKPKVHPWNSVGDAPLASVLLPVAQRPGGAERVKSVMTESKLKSWSSNCPAAADAEKKKWTDLLKLVSEDPA